ncbi:MAG: succinylglutamate desuccinylase/aspartoacylase family protein [Oscillospiraceae bacterium]|nr:succinylglutamate desuccinylase/aspartoacylase family protein [Oscillospiraceae bacterium]
MNKSKLVNIFKILGVAVAAVLLLSTFAMFSVPEDKLNHEDVNSSKSRFSGLHDEVSNILNQIAEKRADYNRDIAALNEITLIDSTISIDNDGSENDDTIDEILPDEEPIPELIHETGTIVPEKFDKYTVTYHLFITGVPGPNIAIIGGVHGTELAGFTAAEQLVDTFNFTAGNFLIIPKATATAPNENGPGGQNLNRQFPGKSTGNAGQKVAAIITELLDNFSPHVIIDYHEAFKDGYSNSVIYWPNHDLSPGKIEAINYVSDAINQTELVGKHLGTYGGRNFRPTRSKSITGTTVREYVKRYNIPVFTTETCMSNKLEVRVEQTLFLTGAFVEFYQSKYDLGTLEPNIYNQTEEGIFVENNSQD